MRFDLVPLLALALALAGCGEGLPLLGDDSDASSDVAVDVDAGPFVPGPHPAFPQQVNLETDGGVVTAMNVVPIFFANDSLQSGIEGLYAQLPSSTYWSDLEKEYGVGAITVAPSIVLTESPPSSATNLQTAAFIASKIQTDPSWPAPTESTLYFVYYPVTTTLSFSTETSCTDFLGYHSHGQSGSTRFLYAAQARCAGGKISPIDDATQNTTHELVEAATDPFLVSYVTQDPAHVIWSVFPGFEIGDLCELEPLSFQRMIGTNLVARFWSNSAAAAGHDPCAPPISRAYFNSVPVLSDPIHVTVFGQPLVTTGVAVPTGTTRTIDVQLFSDAPAPSWQVIASDAANFANTEPGELQFLWDKSTGGNGDTLHLTIRRLKDGANGGSEFVIYSYAAQSVWHAYFAMAGN